MEAIKAVIRDLIHYFNMKTKKGILRLLILLALIVGVFFFISSGAPEETTEEPSLPTVTVAPVTSFDGSASISLIGTVEAVNQAAIESEAAGRVTEVPITLGQEITAGTIVAKLENASQYAALLQAEGAYEAAVAAAAQSDVSVEEAQNAVTAAENGAVSTIRSTYALLQSIVYDSIDQFFADPEAMTPGVKISGTEYTNYLNTERVALQPALKQWQTTTNTLTTTSNLNAELAGVTGEVVTLTNMVTTLIDMFNNEDAAGYTDAEFATFSASFANLQTSLNAQLSAVESAATTLKNARDTLSRIQLTDTSGEVSAANAQIKQALGTLRSAEANYAKTIIRTPISGMVNTVDVKSGDFINAFTSIATVANNNALEVTSFVGDTDRENLEIGQTVIIEDGIEGVITAIAPAVDPVTRKVQVKIGIEDEDIANGDTVRVTVPQNAIESTEDTVFTIPITAVKFSDVHGSIFTVADNALVSHDVTLGKIYGSTVEVLEGVEQNMEIVVDARGLTAGQNVEAIQQ